MRRVERCASNWSSCILAALVGRGVHLLQIQIIYGGGAYQALLFTT
jgi:hypothetical protein